VPNQFAAEGDLRKNVKGDEEEADGALGLAEEPRKHA